MRFIKSIYFKMLLTLGLYFLTMEVLAPYVMLPLAKKIFNLEFYHSLLTFSNYHFSYIKSFYNGLVNNINALLQGSLLMVAFLLMLIPCYQELKKDYNLYHENESKIVNTIGIGILLYFGVNLLTNLISTLIGNYIGNNPESLNQVAIVEMFNSGFLAKIIMVIATVIVGPLVEELVFRKTIFKLVPIKWLALILSSLFFGLIHTISFDYTPIELFLVTLPYAGAGFVFGYVYYKTDNIYAGYLLHAGLNLLSVLTILFI